MNISLIWQPENSYSSWRETCWMLSYSLFFLVCRCAALALEKHWWAPWGCVPSTISHQCLGWNRKEVCFLIESLSTVGLQSLLAECLYLKGLPEESSHLAWYSDGSQITAAGGVWVLCSIRKQATRIGLSWQLGWVSVWSGREGLEDGKETGCLCVTSTHKTQCLASFKCQFTKRKC